MSKYKSVFLIAVNMMFLAMLIVSSLSANSFANDQKCSSGFAFDASTSKCIACNVPCNTGKHGVCGRGVVDCSSGVAKCSSIVNPGDRIEICNGEDDDCNGKVDDGFDKDGDGYTTCGGDCNDRNANIHPDAAERCDGLDDNCNGLIDDGFNVGRVCSKGIGECSRSGHFKCSKSKLNAVCDAIPGLPSKEVCDGRDNDCNGEIDDGIGFITCGVGACQKKVRACVNGHRGECVPAKPVKEICGNGIDDDCDGQIDEGYKNLGKTCYAGIGGCRHKGKMVCGGNGFSLICDAKPSDPMPEICGNGVDDDCDGIVDTDVEGLGKKCDNSMLGECMRSGQMVCDSKTHALVCSAPRVKPQPEICDGKDNNCNGVVDENLVEKVLCGVGRCKGGNKKRICSNGKWGSWSKCSTEDLAVDEICGNGIDDDCDGIVDTDAAGLGAKCDNALLGACHSVGKMVCKGGGQLVCDARIIKGKPEICNGIDDNCDGQVDEDVTNECGTCGKLPGHVGAECHVTGGDECADGIWKCSKESSNGMSCVVEPSISNGRECSQDGKPCTLDVCKNGKCSHISVNDEMECDDGNLCTVGDVCVGGKCSGIEMRSCDDNNPCTSDSCNPLIGCVHSAIGDGILNACGGCYKLNAEVGDACKLDDKSGVCSNGTYMCQFGGGITCVQSTFPELEKCNGLDDNCNGQVDEGFGTTTCGIGSCKITINNCDDGEIKKCIPRDPMVETCSNMGTDDDCNGIVDDIASIGQSCPVIIGTCVVPGTKKCVGDAEYPICVVEDKSYAEDDDGDGIVNYCDYGRNVGGGLNGDVEGKLQQADVSNVSSRLFDTSRTRAVILPWNDVLDSTVVSRDAPDQAMLLLSGGDGEHYGVAAMRIKALFLNHEKNLFHKCFIENNAPLKKIITVGDISELIAVLGTRYYVYPRIASQIPSISIGEKCILHGMDVMPDGIRYLDKDAKKTCSVSKIFNIALINQSPATFAGLISCKESSKSMWRKDKQVLGMDVFIAGVNEQFHHAFIPINTDANDIKFALLSISKGGERAYILSNRHGVTTLTSCGGKGIVWKCNSSKLKKDLNKPVFMADIPNMSSGVLVVSKNGSTNMLFPDGKITGVLAAGRAIKEEYGEIDEIKKFLKSGNPKPVLITADKKSIVLDVLNKKEGGHIKIMPIAGNRFLPESVMDNIFSGSNFDISSPHAIALLPLKHFGGMDLFVSYNLNKHFKKVGEMGFFYWNANESPSGGIADAKFNGKTGSVSFSFSDPTGDKLSYRGNIRAGYGGSLDSWINGFNGNKLEFSVKGDGSVVGLWPITVSIEASDSGGLAAISKCTISRDGTLESISDSTLVGHH